MEATPPQPPPPPPPQAPPPPAAASGGARWPAILLAILFVLVALFFAAVSISLAGDELCEDVLAEAQQTGEITFVECTEKSSGNRTATVIAGGLTAIAAIWALIVSIGIASGRRTWGTLGPAAAATVILAIVTIVL